MAKRLLTEEQWDRIEALLPKPNRSRKRGCTSITSRMVFEGVL